MVEPRRTPLDEILIRRTEARYENMGMNERTLL